MRLLKLYSSLLKRQPVLVQTVQTGLMVASGDIISQSLIEKKTRNEYDYSRTARFFIMGTLIGPSIFIWYRILDKKIGTGSLRYNLTKVAVDQIIFAPIFLSIYMATLCTLEGSGIDQIKTRLKENYTDVLIANYKVWPMVQVVNFSLVPLNYRVPVVQCVAIGWNAYLSWKLNRNSDVQ